MIAERHQHGGAIQSNHGGEKAGDGGSDPEQRERDISEHLLAEKEQHEDHGKRQKSRNFPQTLKDPNLGPGEGGAFDREVVEQSLPGRKAQWHAARHDQQKDFRSAPALQLGGDVHGGYL